MGFGTRLARFQIWLTCPPVAWPWWSSSRPRFPHLLNRDSSISLVGLLWVYNEIMPRSGIIISWSVLWKFSNSVWTDKPFPWKQKWAIKWNKIMFILEAFNLRHLPLCWQKDVPRRCSHGRDHLPSLMWHLNAITGWCWVYAPCVLSPSHVYLHTRL